jgi:cell division protein FtsA
MQEWWKLLTKFYRSESIRTRRSTQKLIAGIVLTGGGAQLKHQAVSRIYYWNGYKNRISNEHLAGNSDEEISSPCTTVGLVMKSIENKTHSAIQ